MVGAADGVKLGPAVGLIDSGGKGAAPGDGVPEAVGEIGTVAAVGGTYSAGLYP